VRPTGRFPAHLWDDLKPGFCYRKQKMAQMENLGSLPILSILKEIGLDCIQIFKKYNRKKPSIEGFFRFKVKAVTQGHYHTNSHHCRLFVNNT
jgi:hypothetical protein